MLLIALCVLSGPLDTLRPYHLADNDRDKLRALIEKEKLAAAGGAVPEAQEEEEATPEATTSSEAATAVAAVAVSRSFPVALLRRAGLPIGIAADASALDQGTKKVTEDD